MLASIWGGTPITIYFKLENSIVKCSCELHPFNYIHTRVAQPVEQLAVNQWVTGSSPVRVPDASVNDIYTE